ncbi:unnamed protein product [Closterium sp. NIES-54]
MLPVALLASAEGSGAAAVALEVAAASLKISGRTIGAVIMAGNTLAAVRALSRGTSVFFTSAFVTLAAAPAAGASRFDADEAADPDDDGGNRTLRGCEGVGKNGRRELG